MSAIFGNVMLTLVALAVVALVAFLPEAGVPAMCWLLGMAVVWRASA